MKYAHPFDVRLANEGLFAWFGPMFDVLSRHWLVAFGAGALTVLVEWLVAKLPWPSYLAVASWWIRALHTIVVSAAAVIISVLAYRLIAHREGLRYRVGDVNTPGDAALRALQIAVVWILFGFAVQIALVILVRLLVALFSSGGPPSANTLWLMIALGMYGWPLIICLLSPLWILLGVSNALSQARAARSLEGPISVVLSSLQLVFSQKWRVFWPAFAFGAVVSFAIYLEIKLQFVPVSLMSMTTLNALILVSVATGLAMTFVIERIYAPDLGIEIADEVAPELTNPPPPTEPPDAGAGPAAPAVPPAAPPAPLSNAAAAAGLIENELRLNRAADLVELTERGLAADPKFFATHTESTVALAKRLVQAERSDLALRILQPYVKEQRSHRLHLTGSLLAAELLSRDSQQLAAAARFLAQLKVYYPDEQMVDRLIRLTEKAVATASAPPAK